MAFPLTKVQWRQNPQRLAWLILVTSFFACTLCSVAIPFSVRQYLLHAQEPRAAYITSLAGTVQLHAPGKDDPTAVTGDRRPVLEGSEITTDKTDRGLLVVAASGGDQILLTAQLYQDTIVRLDEARTPRFSWSQDPVKVSLYLERGRIAIASTPASGRTVSVRVETSGAQVALGAGSFLVEMSGDETLVTARAGLARIQGAGTVVTANNEQRVSVKTGHAPDLPVPAPLNLLQNGAFEDGTLNGWHEVLEVGAVGREPGTVAVERVGQRQVVHFFRRSEDDTPNMVGIQQRLNRDVQGYDSLVVRLDLQLLSQSVPGGGYLASEYPLMLDVFYTDVYGKDLHWRHSFYSQDLPPGSNWRPPWGEKLPVGAWYTYESANLFQELGDTRPMRINTITISASGHDYESSIANVALTVR